MLEYLIMVPALVLASNSPRRRQLLALTGLEFATWTADVDEQPLPGEPASDCVLRLAREKAIAAEADASASTSACLILAFDTLVVDGMHILGKPSSQEDAARVLRQLRNRSHQVHTALAIYSPSEERLATDLCVTNVPMRAYTDAEIQAYVESGDPLDKAGSYAIQHDGFHPVEGLTGCYASVMGLPLCHLARTLPQFGLSVAVDLPVRCQAALQYECPISAAVLRGEPVG